jgi:uncharacterized protein
MHLTRFGSINFFLEVQFKKDDRRINLDRGLVDHHMDAIMIPVIVLIAVGIGFISSMFGIGGGFLLNPSMVILLGMSVGLAVGTIPAVILMMSFSSVIAYARQKRIDFVVTSLMVIPSIGGSVLGALVLIPGTIRLVCFGIVEFILATILALKKNAQERAQKLEIPACLRDRNWGCEGMTLHRRCVDAGGTEFIYSAKLLVALPLSFIAGFLSSFLGIGGGTLYIQIFSFLCGMSIHMAIACSMLSVFVTSISSFATFAVVGQVDYIVAIIFGIGGIFGAQIGARVNKRIHSKYLKPMAAIMIAIIAITMIAFALLKNPT